MSIASDKRMLVKKYNDFRHLHLKYRKAEWRNVTVSEFDKKLDLTVGLLKW